MIWVIKNVSSYDLEKKEDSQTVAQVILSADGVAMEAVCYYTKDNTWSCSSITNIHSSSDDLIYYWVNPVSADATAFEIKDYKTGNVSQKELPKNAFTIMRIRKNGFHWKILNYTIKMTLLLRYLIQKII